MYAAFDGVSQPKLIAVLYPTELPGPHACTGLKLRITFFKKSQIYITIIKLWA